MKRCDLRRAFWDALPPALASVGLDAKVREEGTRAPGIVTVEPGHTFILRERYPTRVTTSYRVEEPRHWPAMPDRGNAAPSVCARQVAEDIRDAVAAHAVRGREREAYERQEARALSLSESGGRTSRGDLTIGWRAGAVKDGTFRIADIRCEFTEEQARALVAHLRASGVLP